MPLMILQRQIHRGPSAYLPLGFASTQAQTPNCRQAAAYRSCTSVTNNIVGEVGIQPHSRGQGYWQIAPNTHKEATYQGAGSCCCDQTALGQFL